uniref:Chromosome 1 open reading frame 198 n=1 Tax=Oryzias sinensis TaxID=183150 RepID=A0A8C7Z802_9TELE
MAAATMQGLGAHRMEEKKLEYFSSINSMARKIMQEREKIKAKHGSSWDKMTPQEQDNAIDNWMMAPQIRARYAMHRVEREEVVCYPKLLIQTGQKIVHFGEEDITWQDEHSAPFSWETKVSASEGQKPGEESSFWKITSVRSRLESEKTGFQSLTPSQIKSMEKGEKPLPSYLRQVRPLNSEPPSLLPPPPPVPASSATVSATPASISIAPSPATPNSTSTGGWERSQSTLPLAGSSLDETFPSSLMSKPTSTPASAEREDKASTNLDMSPTFSQFNTSSSILKTGFDFLDNW